MALQRTRKLRGSRLAAAVLMAGLLAVSVPAAALADGYRPPSMSQGGGGGGGGP